MTTTISDLIDSLGKLKKEKKALEADVSAVTKQISAKEFELMSAMEAEGVLETKNATGKVTLSTSTYPQVESWDKFYDFIKETGYMHMLEKRPAVLAYRELLTMGVPVPGVLPFNKTVLSFRES